MLEHLVWRRMDNRDGCVMSKMKLAGGRDDGRELGTRNSYRYVFCCKNMRFPYAGTPLCRRIKKKTNQIDCKKSESKIWNRKAEEFGLDKSSEAAL